MNIGITVDGENLNSKVSDKFNTCSYLLIVNIDDQLIGKIPRIKRTTVLKSRGEDSGYQLTQKLITYDCEAVITGRLEPAEFELIADACITRYYGAGHQASAALEKMEKRELNMIRNLEGTTGCDEAHHMHQKKGEKL